MFDVVFICFYLSIFLYFHLLLGLFRCFIFVLLISNIYYYFFVATWSEMSWWWVEVEVGGGVVLVEVAGVLRAARKIAEG